VITIDVGGVDDPKKPSGMWESSGASMVIVRRNGATSSPGWVKWHATLIRPSDAIALEGLQRAVTALEELETVAALRRAG
jgi:hypothetical protein